MMPLAGTSSLDQIPGPSTYDASRTLHTIVKPTRLNYAQNPAFQVSGTAWNGTGNGVLSYDGTVIYPLGGAYDGQAVSTLTQSGKVTIATGNGGVTQTLTGLNTGDTYTASMYVLPGPGILDFQLSAGRAVSPSAATGAELNPAVPVSLPPNQYGNTGITYYVAAAGSDTNNGLSPQTAFATIARCNTLILRPGDAILFEGGATFAGAQLALSWAGTQVDPIVIGSWGTGYATLTYSGGHCIYGLNVGGYLITNLNITGPGGTPAYCGVRFHCNGGGQLPRVIITSCVISGWHVRLPAGRRGHRSTAGTASTSPAAASPAAITAASTFAGPLSPRPHRPGAIATSGSRTAPYPGTPAPARSPVRHRAWLPPALVRRRPCQRLLGPRQRRQQRMRHRRARRHPPDRLQEPVPA